MLTAIRSKSGGCFPQWSWPLSTVALFLLLTLGACSRPAEQAAAPAEQAAPQTPAPAEPVPAPVAEDELHAHADGADHHHPPGSTHQDHDSKHGGDFFMAFDEIHHLEGTLSEPGIFRVYLYDEFTKPLSKASVAKAAAKVTWGRAEDSPETAMKSSADGLTLEAKAPAKVSFPTELTLRIRFPGAAPDSRPELFTFPFKAYTHDPAPHKH